MNADYVLNFISIFFFAHIKWAVAPSLSVHLQIEIKSSFDHPCVWFRHTFVIEKFIRFPISIAIWLRELFELLLILMLFISYNFILCSLFYLHAAPHNEISRYSSEMSGNESNEATNMTESERHAEINRQKEEMKIKRRKKKRTSSSMQSSTFKGKANLPRQFVAVVVVWKLCSKFMTKKKIKNWNEMIFLIESTHILLIKWKKKNWIIGDMCRYFVFFMWNSKKEQNERENLNRSSYYENVCDWWRWTFGLQSFKSF